MLDHASPLSTLPTIQYSVTIDGTTQPGYAGKPIIQISGQSAVGSGLLVSADDTTIRGLVINRFSDYGIYIFKNGFPPFNFDIENNYLGTDVTGMLAMGNRWGIGVGAGYGIIGGTTLAARNVISGNTLDGINVLLSSSLSIQGNLIGVAADGVSALGNGEDGVLIPANGSSNTTVGGLDPGQGNIIAFNLGSGIDDYLNGNGRDAYLSNSIYSNHRVGISEEPGGQVNVNNLFANGLTDDTFSNPQNYPVLNSALSSGGQTTISGYLDSRPNDTFLIQFFSNSTLTASGFGQGEVFLGTITVQTDANGHADFTTTIDVSVANHRLMTATATDVAFNQTSEFSERLAVGDVLGNVYTVNTTDDTDDGFINPAHMTLRDAILAANNHPGLDTIDFAIGSGLATISPLVSLPIITDAVIIDGTTQPGFAGRPLIQLSGAKDNPDPSNPAVPDGLHLTGLFLSGNGNTVRGLVINNFYNFGSNSFFWGGTPIAVQGNNNVIVGNFIGTDATDATGTLSLPNLLVSVSRTAGRVGMVAEGNPAIDSLSNLPVRGSSEYLGPSRPTIQQVRALAGRTDWEREVVVTYKPGSGRNGGGGDYYVWSSRYDAAGNASTVFPGDHYVVYHTHARDAFASVRDMAEMAGNARGQQSSIIIHRTDDPFVFTATDRQLPLQNGRR